MLSATSVTTQSSWSLPLKSSAKAEWPDPELSLGRSCRDLGRNKCWEVAGPARAVLDCIFPKVKSLLESRNEYLNEKEPIPVAIIFALYMIGRSAKKSNPTLLFTCEKKAPRRKALSIIMESGLLSPFPGVLLAESARSPLSTQPAVSLALDQQVLHDSANLFDIRLAFSYSPLNGSRGMLINIQSRQEEHETGRRATIGGLVYSENEERKRTYYGITVAHVFSHAIVDNPAPRENDVDEGDEIGFAFYGQSNEDEEENEEFVEITSRGSVSPQLNPSTLDPVHLLDETHTLRQELPNVVSLAVVDTGSIGTLYASSESESLVGLDWAMIELDQENFWRWSTLTCAYPCKIGTKQAGDRKVYTYSGFGGRLFGTMSGNQTLLKLPGADTFQEVWVVRFDGVLNKGDCGSWVVDTTTEALYGHLIAGHLESGLGYIVPAYQMFGDMQKQVRKELNLVQDPAFLQPQSLTGKHQSLIPSKPESVSGRRLIGGDSIDGDELIEIMSDPSAQAPRKTEAQNPISLFDEHSSNSDEDDTPYAMSNLPNPATKASVPETVSPPLIANRPPHLISQPGNQFYQRQSFPTANPADQNPPCNTLYVGNLPIDTTEDELRATFSKQRGYKRLCFRMKQNGPMCFVEFEDVSFATKALHELYGHLMHNSVKGGIRLSFSKNPLGVRSGRASGPSEPSANPYAAQGMNGLVNEMAGTWFSTANGPPPGLAAPPEFGPSRFQNGAFTNQERFDSPPAYMFGK